MSLSWQKLLKNRIPVFGPKLEILAVHELGKRIRLNPPDPESARLLAEHLASYPKENVRAKIIKAISPPLPQEALDKIWEVWLHTRSNELVSLLQEHAKPATTPPNLSVISRLIIYEGNSIGRIRTVELQTLVDALADSELRIASSARIILSNLKKQKLIDKLCLIWLKTRSRLLHEIIREAGYLAQIDLRARTYTALVQNRTDILITSSPKSVLHLISACFDQDPEIAAAAQIAVCQLQDPRSIDSFCEEWAETRNPILENTLLRAHYLPQGNPYVRLLCAIKLGDLGLARFCPPARVKDLVQLCQDKDQVISDRAIKIASSLLLPESILEICDLFIADNVPILYEIIRQGEYLPAEIKKRALILLLTEQFDEYEALDFDYRLLESIYRTANTNLKERISTIITASGKTAYFQIISRDLSRTSLSLACRDEFHTLVQVFTENNDWNRLWSLCFETDPVSAASVITLLASRSWHPDQDQDKRVFDTLLNDLKQIHYDPQSSEPLRFPHLPVAIPSEPISVNNRVIDLAISPNNSHLTLSLSSQELVTWDLKRAARIGHLRGFNHMIVNLNYLPNGDLIGSEKARKTSTCNMYVSRDNLNLRSYGHHARSITSTIPLSQNLIFSSSQDGYIGVWDLHKSLPIVMRRQTLWPRLATSLPMSNQVALLSDQIDIVDIPSLKTIRRINYRSGTIKTHPSVFCSAVFISTDTLIAGNLRGEVVRINCSEDNKKINASLLSKYRDPVRSIAHLKCQNRIICAGKNGNIKVHSTTGTLIQNIDSPHMKINAMKISPDETFMVTGGDNEFVIWDLRGSEFSGILSQPLNQLSREQVNFVYSAQQHKRLPGNTRAILRFIQTLLEYRSRYDIGVDVLTKNSINQFDIEINPSSSLM